MLAMLMIVPRGRWAIIALAATWVVTASPAR